jgi:hypothetical protein
MTKWIEATAAIFCDCLQKQQFKRNQLWIDLHLLLTLNMMMINKFETREFNIKIMIF